MEFYVPDIPAAAREKQIRAAFTEAFRRYYIYHFDFSHWSNKRRFAHREARIIIHSAAVGEEILRFHSPPPPRTIQRGNRTITVKGKPQRQILIAGSSITLLKGKRQDIPEHVINALQLENDKKAKAFAVRQPAAKKPYRQPIPFRAFECGVWTTDPRNPTLPTFNSFYQCPSSGNFRMTKAAIQVDIFSEPRRYMLCLNSVVRHTMVTEQNGSKYFMVSLHWCPKFYEKSGSPPISPAMSEFMGLFGSLQHGNKNSKYRVSNLDPTHAKIAPFCFVYRFLLQEAHDALRISAIGQIPGFLDIEERHIFHQWAAYDFQTSMAGLDVQLANLPFDVAFQLQTLVFNGILLPHRVKELLRVVRKALDDHSTEVVASVLKSWLDTWKPQIPTDDTLIWLTDNIISTFEESLRRKETSTDYLLQMKFYRKENQVLIHRVCITPTGLYPQGPNLEPKNRVLRKYNNHLHHFLRVTLVDEDGGDLRFERGVDGRRMYDGRFLPCLMQDSKHLRIAGRVFTFLGFSQSSLRSHMAWFMTPIWDARTRSYTRVDTVIKGLGDFGHIRFPGKCAARIGQAFTDTVANIKVDAGMTFNVRDIKRTGPDGKEYTFSDGCGTISKQMLKSIWKEGKFDLDRMRPTIFQIRFKGAKGVVSLDSRLPDHQIRLRESMIKFESASENTIEICLSMTKPLPLYTNRQLIKILEDRGIHKSRFLELQSEALATLRTMTLAASHAASFLEYQNRCTAADTAFLIRELQDHGWNYQEDKFLRQVVEFSMLNTLRDMKYRARIPIEQGFTLIGIVDETNYLHEGEIYMPIKKEGEKRWAHRGRVAICKSPALHPGDVQLVTAIEVPVNSPLRELTNCVVFSQRGDRDLPNMLSGGDLDGDLYHVWWDPRFMPTKYCAPAKYETGLKGQELTRPVTQDDIGRFFLDFMENDKLGVICTAHMIIADSSPEGVYSQDCLKCAGLASQAVDFPKTGIPVKMSDLPRTSNYRPDFLRPSPRVGVTAGKYKLSNDPALDPDSEDEDDVDPTLNSSPFTARGGAGDVEDPFSAATQFTYYESPKALGCLFREIDEEKFITAWEDTARGYEKYGPDHLLGQVQDFFLRFADMQKVAEVYQFATHLRVSYEQNMRDLAMSYATSRHNLPLEEVEVFIGCIIGTESHRQTRLQRDNAESLRGEVNRLISQVMRSIRHGSEGGVVEDGKYDGCTLERALTCVMASFTAREDKEGGKSFGWLAAAVGLKELAKRGERRRDEDVLRAFRGLAVS
ncbi:hypothetical protein TWF694_004626 [Orbilia ellipsospora]|uniref:RNA-dependent RNA polymerase n=1 Tax=Orbilia ellipsospora TaxID=2528407 RepID=A0AAV9WVT4_9PEZI